MPHIVYHPAPSDEVSYNSVLHAMTKESDPKWVARAERLFQEMKDKKVPVNEITYHVLMNIFSKSGDNRDGGAKVDIRQAWQSREGIGLAGRDDRIVE